MLAPMVDSLGALSEFFMSPQVQQVIEFLFFLVLLLCAQKMLSHAIGT